MGFCDEAAFFQMFCAQYFKPVVIQRLEQRFKLAPGNVVLADGRVNEQDREIQLLEHGRASVAMMSPRLRHARPLCMALVRIPDVSL